jgi:hypothetical protein
MPSIGGLRFGIGPDFPSVLMRLLGQKRFAARRPTLWKTGIDAEIAELAAILFFRNGNWKQIDDAGDLILRFTCILR